MSGAAWFDTGCVLNLVHVVGVMNVDQGFAGARVVKTGCLAALIVCTADATVPIVAFRLHDAWAAHCDLIWFGAAYDLLLAVATAGILLF